MKKRNKIVIVCNAVFFVITLVLAFAAAHCMKLNYIPGDDTLGNYFSSIAVWILMASCLTAVLLATFMGYRYSDSKIQSVLGKVFSVAMIIGCYSYTIYFWLICINAIVSVFNYNCS